MKRALVLFLSFGCGALAVAGVTWGVQQQQKRAIDVAFERRHTELLRQENERLRTLIAQPVAVKPGEGRKDESAARTTIEEAVAAIRGLPFKEPVAYKELTHEGIKETIRQKLEEQVSDEEFKNGAIALAAMGLLPKGFPLQETYIDLLGEQVAAFYDQHQHQLFMFENASLQSLQNRIVLAHELTHALQDQNFGLRKLPLEIKTNDDRAISASALVEGDATLVMSAYLMQNMSVGDLGEALSGLMTQNMEQLQKAPRYLRELLLFPYLKGQEFCGVLHARGGYKAISAAFENPPSSTSQIMHPEKYLATPREEPVAIEWSNVEALGQKPIADNVLGELGTEILISEWSDGENGKAAAAGWRGDRYLVFAEGEAMVWRSTWGNPAEAMEFFQAARNYLQKRYQLPANPDDAAESFAVGAPRVLQLRCLAPSDVVLIDCATEEWAAVIARQFGEVEKRNEAR